MKRDESVVSIVPEDVAKEVKKLKKQQDKIKARMKELSDEILTKMQNFNVSELECQGVLFKVIPASYRDTLDIAKIKEDMPSLSDKYNKRVEVKPTLKIEIEKPKKK